MVLEYRSSCAGWEVAHRPTWAEISLDAVTENTRRLRSLAGPAALMAVVKADGYGHGAVECARATLEGGASWLAVAALEEGIELRRDGIGVPILILGPSSPAQAPIIVEHDLHAAVFEMEVASALAAAGREAGRPARAQIKVDTGMGRIGVTPDADGAALAARISGLEGLEVDGAYTHYATSDEEDKTFARRQTAFFDRFLAHAARAGLNFRWRHAANSAALFDLPETLYDMVRVGISLYGLYPSNEVDHSRVQLAAAMTWKTRLMQVKRVPAGTPVSYGGEFVAPRSTVVGTLPVGYADGYRRLLSGRGRVLVGGRSCPVLGRVNMDHMMVGLGDMTEAGPGDEAVLIGTQSHYGGGVPSKATITAEEVAEVCGTINYEIVTGVGHRVPRVFLRGGRPVSVRSILGFERVGGAFC